MLLGVSPKLLTTFLSETLARSFAQMARTAEQASRGVQVSKVPMDHPPFPIHKLGDQVLRRPARRISKVDESVRELARDLLRTMYAAKGIGLAAPQVGVHKQLLVIDLEPENESAAPMVLINPEITGFGAAIDTYEEGCLSIPGVYLDVVRPSVVEVSFRDGHGRPQKIKADGLLARCIQHEMDHLNGVLFVDRVTDELSLNEELKQQGFDRAAVHSIR
jgi:peptide deformylase